MQYGEGHDIVQDLQETLAFLMQKPAEERNELGYGRLLSLISVYRPNLKAVSADALAATDAMDLIPAIKHVRAVLGVGLREAKDLVENRRKQNVMATAQHDSPSFGNGESC